MRRPRLPTRAIALVALAVATIAVPPTAAARRLAGARPRTTTPLPFSNVTLGSVDVVLVVPDGAAALVDDVTTRAGVLNGLATATDWMSVCDVAAVAVLTDDGRPAAAACGTTGHVLKYRFTLTPAVLPTLIQAAQLSRAEADVARELRALGVEATADVSTVDLDRRAMAAEPAPFPAGATGHDDDIYSAWGRAKGVGLSLCPPADLLLPALRSVRNVTTYGGEQYVQILIEQGKTLPWRGYANAANTRWVRFKPLRPEDLPSADTFALGQFGDRAAMFDAEDQIRGMTRKEARDAATIMIHLSRDGVYARALANVPEVRAASALVDASTITYNGRPVFALPPGALAAVVIVSTVALAAAATGAGFALRRRAARVAAERALAQGSGRPSDLLRALAATPSTSPLDRLAAVEWELDPGELSIVKSANGTEEELGAGASGVVYRGRHAGQDVAIKILKREHAGDREDMAKEALMLRGCRHPNVVAFVGAIFSETMPSVLVTELVERGSLFDCLQSYHMDAVFRWRRARTDAGRPRPRTGLNRRIALDVARGLAYLHSRSIVHMDVKSPNVLLARDLTAKVADVGLARVLVGDALSVLSAPAGTLSWMAPEVLLGSGESAVNDKADMFSYGVVLWELSTQSRPKRPLPPLDERDAPPAIRALVHACLAPDPADRPAAADVVAALEAMDDDCEPLDAPAKLSQRMVSWVEAKTSGF